MSDVDGQAGTLHLRWLSNGKVTACGAGTGKMAPKPSAVTCRRCRATLPWQISALVEPFEEMAAAYRKLGEGMARALRLMPAPEPRRTAEQIIRSSGVQLRPAVPFQVDRCRTCRCLCVGAYCDTCSPLSPFHVLAQRAKQAGR